MALPNPPIFDPELLIEEQGMTTWCWRVQSGTVEWSQGIDALFGLPPGGFGGTYEAYLALVHPEDRAHFQALIERTLAGEDEYVMAHRTIWPDGSIRWIDGRGKLTRDANGQPLQLDGVTWDADARRRAESRRLHLRRVQSVAVAVSKELLRVRNDGEALARACRIVVEHGHFRFAWVGVVVEDGTRVSPVAFSGAEEGYLAETGVTTELLLSGEGPVERTVRERGTVVINDIAKDASFARWREPALLREYRASATLPILRAGQIFGVLAIYASEQNRFDVAQLELLQSLANDIGFTLDLIDEAARRRAAEVSMTRSEKRFRALFEHASDGILIAESDGRILEANPAACALTGFSLADLRLRTTSDLFEGTPTDLRLNDAPTVVERRLQRRDGSWIDTEVSATTLDDGRIQAHLRDVTLRKRMQQQLIFADRLASLGRLAAGVAHEVNNPLAYSMLSLQRIERALSKSEESPLLSEIRAATAHALDGAERVRAVVRALGAFGREDDDSAGVVDLHKALDAAVRLAESRVKHRGQLTKDYRATQPVRAHELRLGQVFVNLLVNAADALGRETTESNRIGVRTIDDGAFVVVEISDNGVGIPPEIIEKIFDPFFTTKGVGEGTGLGLSISHSILDSFCGTISVTSNVGSGSVFRVRLMGGGPLHAESKAPATGALVARSRILIVDDEPILAATLARVLERHEVTVGRGGREALELCAENEYDFVFCDLMMPGMSGIDLHTELARAKPSLAKRFVFMTGGAFTDKAREFIAEVPNRVLEKPFDPSLLEQVLAEVEASYRAV